MEIKVTKEQGRVPVTVVHVDGNIDSHTAGDFQSRVEELIQEGARDILVDMAHVPYISSAGLRTLQAVFNQLRALSPDVTDAEMRQGVSAGTYTSPHLKLANMSKDASSAFKMAGFDMYIEVYDDVKQAVDSF
jgi:anti-anti-sigma factor